MYEPRYEGNRGYAQWEQGRRGQWYPRQHVYPDEHYGHRDDQGDYGRQYGQGQYQDRPYGSGNPGSYGRYAPRGHAEYPGGSSYGFEQGYGRTGHASRGAGYGYEEGAGQNLPGQRAGGAYRPYWQGVDEADLGAADSSYFEQRQSWPGRQTGRGQSPYNGMEYMGSGYNAGPAQRSRYNAQEPYAPYASQYGAGHTSWGGGAAGEYGRASGPSGRGQHWGKGPKGYTRSDERITEEISDNFASIDELDPSDIEVSVSGGIVTLSGLVESRQDKFYAEQVAESVMGVKDVVNQIRLRGTSEEQRSSSDADSKRGISRAASGAGSGSSPQRAGGVGSSLSR